MKWMITFVFIIGIATVGKTQDDSVSQDPTFNCRYIDKDNFTCELEDKGRNSRRKNGSKDSDNKNPVNENPFNEWNQNINNQEFSAKPEVESDEGIMDSSCIIDSTEVKNESSTEMKSE
jgi:hypothetical protein